MICSVNVSLKFKKNTVIVSVFQIIMVSIYEFYILYVCINFWSKMGMKKYVELYVLRNIKHYFKQNFTNKI